MKIYRGPRTGRRWRRWQETDAKALAKWVKNWEPGHTLSFDGTIDKTGERHTDFGVEFTPEDIVALHVGLLHFQKKHIRKLEKENVELAKTVELLEEALAKIYYLISFHSNQAPSKDELLNTVERIADHFRRSFNRDKPFNPKWIKWKSI